MVWFGYYYSIYLLAERETKEKKRMSMGGDDRQSPVRPNWLKGVIPKIATGAAGLLSSFLHTSQSSSSSSYTSSSSQDTSHGEGSDNEFNYPLLTYDESDRFNKDNGSTSDYAEGLTNKSQLTIRKSETKLLIQNLILKETFSREERDSLMSLINSRVIDRTTISEGLVTRSDSPELCTKVIMEAKQWIEEKREASSSRLKLADGKSTLMLTQGNNDGLGSPVDVAKTYMRERPPWSSPSLYSAGQKTPSPLRRKILKDESPYGSSFSSSKRKFSSLSSGSWNIQDEIRRVRSKATEDILKSVGASSDIMGVEVGTSGCVSASALDTTQKKLQAEDVQLQPTTVARLQRVEDIQMVKKDKEAALGSIQSAIPEPVLNDDLRFMNKSHPTTDRDTEFRGVENNHDKLVASDRREETCELLSETMAEVPCTDKTDNVAVDNSNKHTEQPSKVVTRTRLVSTTTDGKAQGKKWSRYNRKTKGKD